MICLSFFFFNPLVFVTTLSFLKRLLFLSAIAFNSQEMHHRSYSCCHHAFFPDTCVICGAFSDCVPHLFLHCSAAVSLWHSLFAFLVNIGVSQSLDQILMNRFHRSRSKEANFCGNMQSIIYATIWCICLEFFFMDIYLECYYHIFKEVSLAHGLI